MKLTEKCLEFISRLSNSIDEIYSNPAVSPAEATQAVTEGMAQALRDPTIRERVGTFIRSSYLSALSTHVINIVNQATQLVAAPILRAAGGKPGEANAMLQGITRGFLEAFPRFFVGLGKRTEDFDGNAHTAFDIVRNKYADAALTYPLRLTGALDQAFSAVLERMEFNSMLHRIENKFPEEWFARQGLTKEVFLKEMQEIALKRKDGNVAFLNLLKEKSPALYQQLQDFSAFNTFRTPLGNSLIDVLGKHVVKAKDAAPELNLFVPFIRTPINVMKEAGGYLPGGGALRARQAKKDIAELDGKIAASQDREAKLVDRINKIDQQEKSPWTPEYKKEELAAKKERLQEMVRTESIKRQKLEGSRTFKEEKIPEFHAQQAIGLGFMATAYGLYQSGNITGHYSEDPAVRQRQIASKIPEMSIKIGDKWYSYNRIEPLSTVMGLVVDTMSNLRDKKIKGDEAGIGDVIRVVRQNLLDKTFTQGLAHMMLAFQDWDRYGESWLVSWTNPLVPAVLNQVARLEDPIKREIKDPDAVNWVLNNLKSRLPGLRDSLPAATNLAGQQQELTGVLTGLQTAPQPTDAVNEVFSNPYLNISRMSRKIGSIELDANIYNQMETNVGRQTYQVAAMLANNPGFNALHQSFQAQLIKGVVSELRRDERLRALNYLVQDPLIKAQYAEDILRRAGLGSMFEE
jgi:hypothetical protein